LSSTKPKTEVSAAKPDEEMNLMEFVKIFIFAGLVTFFLRLIVFDPFTIPSESMVPNLVIGDYLVVSKSSYGYSKYSVPVFKLDLFDGRIMESPIERGDVAVFKLPRDNKTDYIKRIVGLPGDHIQMQNGQLFVNGVGYERRKVEDFVIAESENTNCRRFPAYRIAVDDGFECHYPQYREVMPNGRSYLTLDLRQGSSADNTHVYVVPAGHYFGMGDNRDNSIDSRWPTSQGVGYIPVENFVGRAISVLWSSDGGSSWLLPWTWFSSSRSERMFYSLSPDQANEEN
jgi:signal peptidase I